MLFRSIGIGLLYMVTGTLNMADLALRLDAVAVRSARYDTDVMRVQFRSERLVVVAPVTESADGDTGVAAYGETRFDATGDVDGTFEVLSVLDAREDPERRRPIQTATFRAAEAILTRGAALAPTVDPNDAENPFTFRAREVDRFVLDRPLVNGTSAHYELECETLDIDGVEPIAVDDLVDAFNVYATPDAPTPPAASSGETDRPSSEPGAES